MYRCYRVAPTLSLTQICAANIFVDSFKPTLIGQTLHHSPEKRPSEVLQGEFATQKPDHIAPSQFRNAKVSRVAKASRAAL
ncbi:MAG: hypothetical protein DMF05_01930 [Verrucomicrobia bacterium]|nr:MAG: hypothetical protein DMF05_01930 [Verrucomicrobiota bacterium]